MKKEIVQLLDEARRDAAAFVNEKYFVGKSTHFSPSRRFRIDLSVFEDKGINEDGHPYQHHYLKAIIFDGEKVVREILAHLFFFFEWIENGPEQNYLICSEYYQGYGILDLDRNAYEFFLPDEVIDGEGFIWAKGHLSPGKNKLAIEGCVWAAPYQIKIFDLSNLFSLPYKCLYETPMENAYTEIIGWVSNDEFEFEDEDKKITKIKV